MNVVNLELCKELYELSSWDDCVWFHWKSRLYTSAELRGQTMGPGWEPVPAYDLGYLLRKLPKTVSPEPLSPAWLFLDPATTDTWAAGYRQGAARAELDERADTPEDAAAKLAIELFKAGVLKR